MNLDERLKDLFYEHSQGQKLQDDELAEIKQAFADAGWIHSPLVDYQFKRIKNGDLMTGQEWYSRFEKLTTVMNQVVQLSPGLDKSYKKTQQQLQDIYLEAARRVTRLDQ